MINFLRPGWAMMLLTMILPLMACSSNKPGKIPDTTNSNRPEALLILDFQNDFLGPAAKLAVDSIQGQRAIATVQTLLKSVDTTKTRVAYIGNEFPLSDFIANWFRNNAAIEGTKGAEILPEIPIISNIYFSKKEGDAFSNNRLDLWLKQHSISKVKIAGVFADQCVLATAKGALRKGYSVSVYRNGVATSNEKNLNKAYKRFTELGIGIIDSP